MAPGAWGEVYKAKDTRLERTVAIKVLPEHLAKSAEGKQRFEREAKIISKLNHPHICTLYDIGNQNGVDFLVMEYIEGDTLSERLKKGPLPLEQALRYGIQIADGLDKAHRAGIVHRDLKPGNVMLTASGIKILDFGLAKHLQTDTSAGTSEALTKQKELTDDQAIVGTLQYMAPEQLEGKSADTRSDVWAFGALLYEMITGTKAFTGESQASVITAIMTAEPPPLTEKKPLSPPLLEHQVKRCLEKDPGKRWQSVADLKLELEWLATAPELGPTTPAPSGRELVLAHPGLYRRVGRCTRPLARQPPRAGRASPQTFFDPTSHFGFVPVVPRANRGLARWNPDRLRGSPRRSGAALLASHRSSRGEGDSGYGRREGAIFLTRRRNDRVLCRRYAQENRR